TAMQEMHERESAAIRAAHPQIFGGSRTFGASVEQRENDLVRGFLRGDLDRDPNAERDEMGRAVLRIPVGRARKELDLIRDGASPTEARALAWGTGSIASAVP